jgi:hypothetical protein
MKSDRMVIGAVLFLAAGLGLLFGFTDGTAGVNLGYPFSATKLHVDITTTGIPVIAGLPLIAAIVSQFRQPEHDYSPELPTKRQGPFEE